MVCVWVWLLLHLPVAVDFSYPEGAVVARAYDAAQGKPVYQNWRHWPHAFAPYAPLTYYPVGWAARLISSHPHPRSIYSIGRLQSLLNLAGIGVLIAGIQRRLGMSGLWLIPAVALFFGWETNAEFAASYRPDAPQVFFSLLAFWIALGGPPTLRRVAFALLCLSISLWLKPASLGMCFILGFWILRGRGWRQALGALSVFFAFNLILAIVLNHISNGMLFLNVVSGAANGMRWQNLAEILRRIGPVPMIVVLLAVALSVRRLVRRSDESNESLFSLAVLIGLGMTLIQCLNVGAGTSYFLESYALACIALALGCRQLWYARGKKWRIAREIVLALIIYFIVLKDGFYGTRSVVLNSQNVVQSWKTPEIMAFLQTYEAPILTSYPYLAVARPAPPTLNDFAQFIELSIRDRIRDGEVIERLQKREFKLAILQSNLLARSKENPLPAPMVDALFSNYRVSKTMDSGIKYMVILEPISGTLPD